MGQFTLFFLFIITLIVGVLAYIGPKHLGMPSSKAVVDDSDNEMTGDSFTSKAQQWNVSTNGGVVEFNKQMDELTQKHKSLVDMIEGDHAILQNTQKEINDITSRGDGKNTMDVLRLKALGLQMQDEQDLLVAHGQELIDVNNQIGKKRQMLSDQKDLLNMNTASSIQSLQDHDSSVSDKSATLFDKVDEEEQKAQDQQEQSRQRIEDEQQRIQDQQNR